ncbi:DinB family protein [Niastella sp. OAS944]|uniref:DinB family protein n=1 Tax=Niastella sp. OAS944 TaxID=2664089 RepID=UPI003495831E|nr:putative damage-inducible protein DinB [Chitinophagaceae bacterium OAS944]
MSASKWFERKFDFSFDVNEYTTIYRRLLQAPESLEIILQNKSNDILSYQPDGKWSVKEHTGHLSVLEPLWRARIQDIIEKRPTLTPTDLNNSATSEAGFNKLSITELIQRFAVERRQTLVLLDSINISGHTNTSLHPRMQQPMRIIDIAYFTAEHDDHHMGVIGEILVQN